MRHEGISAFLLHFVRLWFVSTKDRKLKVDKIEKTSTKALRLVIADEPIGIEMSKVVSLLIST